MWQRSKCNFFNPSCIFSLNLTLQRASSGLKDLYVALLYVYKVCIQWVLSFSRGSVSFFTLWKKPVLTETEKTVCLVLRLRKRTKMMRYNFVYTDHT